jgi:voltage-gated potassium channel
MDNRKRIYMSLIVFAAVFVIGVIGFKIVGGPGTSILDSVYMTAITISTIGYGEAVDLSHNPAGRIFAVLFIVLSLGTIAFAVSSITAFIVEGELKNLLGRRRMEKEIAKLKDHYIVCGSDETAQTVIRELIATERDFVVIESSKERIERLSSLGEFLYVLGDPAEDEILEKAQVRKARGVILSLPSDEANLFVTITVRSLNPQARIVAKGTDLKSHGKIRKAGADSVVSPSFIGGMRMVSDMVRPSVVTFLDKMLYGKDRVLRVEEFEVGKESPLVGKTLQDSTIREKTGALLVAMRKGKKGDYEFNPGPDRVIQEEDVLIFIGSPEMAKAFDKIATGA